MAADRTFFYDLHGLLTVRLRARGAGRWRGRMLDAKLAALARDDPGGPADVEMEIGPFAPDIPADALVIDKDFHVAEGYVYFRGRRGGATEIVGLDRPHTLVRHDPCAEGPFRRIARGVRGMGMYLEPVIAWRLRGRGAYLMHAAAVARDDSAMVVFGANGSGKTRAVLELCLREGFSLLGDDLIVLHAGRAVGFIEHPAVLHARARSLAAGGACRARPVKVAAAILAGKVRPCAGLRIAQTAPATCAVLLERVSRPGGVEVEPMPAADVWARAVGLERLELNRHQRRHRQVMNFGRFLMACECARPGGPAFAEMLMEEVPLPGWLDLPAARCRVGPGGEGDLARRLAGFWETSRRTAP